MSAKKNAAQPVTIPNQPEPEEKARKEPKSRPVIFRAKRGEKAAGHKDAYGNAEATVLSRRICAPENRARLWRSRCEGTCRRK